MWPELCGLKYSNQMQRGCNLSGDEACLLVHRESCIALLVSVSCVIEEFDVAAALVAQDWRTLPYLAPQVKI